MNRRLCQRQHSQRGVTYTRGVACRRPASCRTGRWIYSRVKETDEGADASEKDDMLWVL